MDRDGIRKIFICGHRNPDVDSIMSACALAEFKKATGESRVEAVCPGLMPDRADWLFKKFKIQPPKTKNDVYLRVRDIMRLEYTAIPAHVSLFDAVKMLKDARSTGMPVVDHDGKYLGLLSSYNLISELLNIGSDNGKSFTGREIYSSFAMVTQVLDAEVLAGDGTDSELHTFDAFVAAMSSEFFDKHLNSIGRNEPAIIVGDRPEIHLRVLQRPVKLMIITGNCPVESSVVELAQLKKVTILRTACDSATVIRRLKFSTPVGKSSLNKTIPLLSPEDMVRDVKSGILAAKEDLFPVCAEDRKLLGLVSKYEFTSPPPFKMILVDHNEITQGIPGLEEIPVMEVVDHHRIGMRPTAEPIKFTADVVGSTCTLVAAMFRSHGIRPHKGTAGLLLSGIVTDTLLFQSPTTTETDRMIGQWLEKLAEVSASDLMNELMEIDSPLAVKKADEVINSDRKNYLENEYRFALSQVEETNLELLHRRHDELAETMRKILESESLDFIALLVTDPVRGNSELLALGNQTILRALPYAKRKDSIFTLPGILSRKKQLLPQILAMIAAHPK